MDAHPQAIEDDLVSARAENKQLGQEHFHRWLTTARLVAQSFGEGDLTCARENLHFTRGRPGPSACIFRTARRGYLSGTLPSCVAAVMLSQGGPLEAHEGPRAEGAGAHACVLSGREEGETRESAKMAGRRLKGRQEVPLRGRTQCGWGESRRRRRAQQQQERAAQLLTPVEGSQWMMAGGLPRSCFGKEQQLRRM